MMQQTERSSAWLEHLLWEQDVAGSNPVAPTIFQGKAPKKPKTCRAYRGDLMLQPCKIQRSCLRRLSLAKVPLPKVAYIQLKIKKGRLKLFQSPGKGKGIFMARTRRQGKIAAGNRAAQGESRINLLDDQFATPRSRRRHETTRRGFAAMDPKQQRKIAALGGSSFHRGPRGFAAMSERRRRQIASQGGSAYHSRPRGFAAMNSREQRAIAARGGSAPRQGPRGFAAMRRQKQRAVAARGGRASHAVR